MCIHNQCFEAVPMCIHNQCFRAKTEKYYDFSSENLSFYSRELLLYIAWACFHNVMKQLVSCL